jgi:hypothetical protein
VGRTERDCGWLLFGGTPPPIARTQNIEKKWLSGHVGSQTVHSKGLIAKILISNGLRADYGTLSLPLRDDPSLISLYISILPKWREPFGTFLRFFKAAWLLGIRGFCWFGGLDKKGGGREQGVADKDRWVVIGGAESRDPSLRLALRMTAKTTNGKNNCNGKNRSRSPAGMTTKCNSKS